MNSDIFRRRPFLSFGENLPGKYFPSAGGLCLLVLFLLISPASSPVWAAGQEETVHLSLQKRVYREDRGEVYTVRKGDWIYRIIRKACQVSPGDEYRTLEAIRALNPGIKNFDAIYPGQRIYLPKSGEKDPGRETTALPAEKKTLTGEPPSSREATVSYRVRRGDTLSTILVRRFDCPKSQLDHLLGRVKELNPRLSGLDRIYPGQVLLFPRMSESWMNGRSAAKEIPEPPPAEKQGNVLPALREVLQYLDGRLETKGAYYIPIVPSGLITLPCERFPVVEFSSGKKVVLDLSGRMEAPLKEMLRASWEGCSVLDPPRGGNFRSVLDGVVSRSGVHKVEQMKGLMETGDNPRIRLRIDQTIVSGVAGKEGAAKRLSIRYVRSREELLTENLKRVLRERGLPVIEIMESKEGVEVATGDLFGGRTAVRLQGDSPVDLAGSFLSLLQFSVVRNEDLFFSDSSEERFGLSVKADLYGTKGAVRLALFSRDPHPRLREIMSQREIIVETFPGDSGKQTTLQRLMTVLRLPAHSGEYAFPLPGDGGEKIILSAIRLDVDGETLYFVGGEMGEDLIGYLMEKHGVKVVTF